MTNGQYDSRKEQIEKGFMRELPSGLDRKLRKHIRDRLRDAAMVGACEERDRTLKLLRDRISPHLLNSITADPVMKVLGYE